MFPLQIKNQPGKCHVISRTAPHSRLQFPQRRRRTFGISLRLNSADQSKMAECHSSGYLISTREPYKCWEHGGEAPGLQEFRHSVKLTGLSQKFYQDVYSNFKKSKTIRMCKSIAQDLQFPECVWILYSNAIRRVPKPSSIQAQSR